MWTWYTEDRTTVKTALKKRQRKKTIEFEVSRFTHSEDMTEAKKLRNWSHGHHHAPSRDILLGLSVGCCGQPMIKFQFIHIMKIEKTREKIRKSVVLCCGIQWMGIILGHRQSHQPIESIWLPIRYAFNRNFAPVSYYFRDIASFCRQSPVLTCRCASILSIFGFHQHLWRQETRVEPTLAISWCCLRGPCLAHFRRIPFDW